MKTSDSELKQLLFKFEIDAHTIRIEAITEGQYENKMHKNLENAEQAINQYCNRKIEEARADEFLWVLRKLREYDFNKDIFIQNIVEPNEEKYLSITNELREE